MSLNEKKCLHKIVRFHPIMFCCYSAVGRFTLINCHNNLQYLHMKEIKQTVSMNTSSLMKEKVVIIIPTYNESLVIEETITQLFAVANSLSDFDVEVLIFDSASTDDTQAQVKTLCQQFTKLHLQTEPQKTGLGSAYIQAMRYALDVLQADIVVEFDADLSHQPKFIPPILECLKTCDVVIGSRYIQGGSIPKNWGMHRKFLSCAGNYLTRMVLTMQYKDFTSGFRATRKNRLHDILPDHFLSKGYAYKLHLLWLLHKNNAVIREIPIHFVDRQKGVSKLPTNSIHDSLRVIFTLRYLEIRQFIKLFLQKFNRNAA